MLANRGVDDDILEMERCKKAGLRAVHLTTYPSGSRWPTPDDDRFFAAALDLEMPVCIHTQMAIKRGERGEFMIQYPIERTGYERPPIDIVDRMSRYGTTHCGTLELTQMIMTGLFDRFPDLKIYWAENEVGWIPIYLEQMDLIYEANRFWVERNCRTDRAAWPGRGPTVNESPRIRCCRHWRSAMVRSVLGR
jgi:predicted TIM-barrel fold metal-dependent hydrolase